MKIFVTYLQEEEIEVDDKFLPIEEETEMSWEEYDKLETDFKNFLNDKYGMCGWWRVEADYGVELAMNDMI